MQQRLAPGDAVVDVGANLGYFTLLASRLVGNSGKVVAVEALPATFSALDHNLKINQVRNVRAVNCAAWDREETLTIYSRPEEHLGLTTVMTAWAEEWRLKEHSQVRAAPLSTILQPEEVRLARIVKIDVEGAEWHALLGMKSLLGSCREDLEVVVEVTPKLLEKENKTSQDFLDLMSSYGFNAYQIENDYGVESYMRREALRTPKRVRGAFAEQADLIFSRIDAETL
jgi:FkbM family methyltransferase